VLDGEPRTQAGGELGEHEQVAAAARVRRGQDGGDSHSRPLPGLPLLSPRPRVHRDPAQDQQTLAQVQGDQVDLVHVPQKTQLRWRTHLRPQGTLKGGPRTR